MLVEYEGYLINVQYISLPPGTHGSVTLNSDGCFTMFLDPNDSIDMQRYGFQHEFEEHIKGDHLYNIEDKNADKIETEAHHLAEPPKKHIVPDPIIIHVPYRKSVWEDVMNPPQRPKRSHPGVRFTRELIDELKKDELLRYIMDIRIDEIPKKPNWPPRNWK